MKDLYWVGSSKEDLKEFPEDVIDVFGFALHQVQLGDMPECASPLRGKHLSGVYELEDDFNKSTYRVAYIAKLETGIYVLHSFQKKSKKGIATPKKEIELIEQRLKWAKEQNESILKSKKD